MTFGHALDPAAVGNAFLLAFPALFSIVNPIGASLVFADVTAGRLPAERRLLSRRVALYSAILLLVSLWAGSEVLRFFGISLSALRIAGGLVVAVRAWDMLQTPERQEANKERQAHQDGRTAAAGDVAATAFFPLTMPFTVGPGSISVAVALGAERPVGDTVAAIDFGLGTSLAAIAMSLVVWALYSSSPRLVSMLGRSGSRIVTRLVALILLAIGVQIVMTGVQQEVLDLAAHIRMAD
ncbi:multiple antibiotic resistance protein [Endobacter medicaginis]|uniref:UPF0056 membrane protein n=1 Tax=Endobacter medicaginis TaxID=1181271 RepID=A0A839UX95_9PROT|nr:MarC family protein [Endobacter medicaginis]MBB3172700.1 multiple antibiotic resistance protein [Endobacter medicaginis]MCX5474307.1 MarC family protein [Endobacter medicaginis]NVN30299.1 MarC family protein [Endobacter medicaginis]